MKKKHLMPELKEGSVNVTPLIDIVMCLIIFFMLVAKIGVSRGAEPMELPETFRGTKIDDLGNTLTLNVRNSGGESPKVTALVEGHQREIGMDFAEDGKSANSLVSVLSILRARNAKFQVIIRAEKDLPYRLLEPVLLACTQANVQNVSFNTRVAAEVQR